MTRAIGIVTVLLALAGSSLVLSACGSESSKRSTYDGSGRTAADPVEVEPISPASTANTGTVPQATDTAEDIGGQLEDILALYDDGRHFEMVKLLSSDAMEGRLTGSAGARAAASAIEKQFTAAGLMPWSALGLDGYRQHFSINGVSDDNIIGILPGNDPAAGYVVIAGHYDHLGVSTYGQVYNGADDNAAGAAAVVEAAHVMSECGMRPARTMVFCAFSGEEAGQLGASSFGALINEFGLSHKVEVINIDGIGATGGSYLGVWDEGSVAASPLVNSFHEAVKYTGVDIVEEGTDIGSDAQPLNWVYGIPAVTVDWDWGSDPSRFHPYYHSVDDDAQYINRQVMEDAMLTILAAFWLRSSSAA